MVVSVDGPRQVKTPDPASAPPYSKLGDCLSKGEEMRDCKLSEVILDVKGGDHLLHGLLNERRFRWRSVWGSCPNGSQRRLSWQKGKLTTQRTENLKVGLRLRLLLKTNLATSRRNSAGGRIGRQKPSATKRRRWMFCGRARSCVLDI